MQKWEYMNLTREIKDEGFLGTSENYYWGDDEKNTMSLKQRLNYLGEEGWELVSAMPLSRASTSAYSGQTTRYMLILKRPKE